MPDFNLPGVSNKYDIKGIIDKLVSVESKKLDRFEKAKEELNTEKSAWISLGSKIKNLQTAAEALYGFRSPFEDKVARSSDESIFSATASRIAEPSHSQIRVAQLAQNERVLSDPVPGGETLPPALIKIYVGDKELAVDFPGGRVEQLAEQINKQAGEYLNARIARDTEQTSVLILETKQSGEKNRIRIADPASVEFFKRIGLIEERPGFSIDTAFKKEKLAPLEETSLYSLKEDILSLEPRNSVELLLDRAVGPQPDLYLRLQIRASEIKRMEEAPAVWPPLKGIGKVSVKDIEIEGGRAISAMPEPERKPAPPPVVDNEVIGLGSGEKILRLVEAEGLAEQFVEYSFALRDLLKEGESTDRLLFINNNSDRRIEYRNVVIEDRSGRTGIVAKHSVQEGRDAVLFIDGVRVQRGTNEIDDALKGVRLSLKDSSEKAKILTVERDYEIITKRTLALVNEYNELLRFINEQTRVVASGKLSEKNEVGALTGDITVMGLKNKLQTIMMNPYPTEKGKELALLAQIGISMGKMGASWADIKGGMLAVDEDKFVEAFEKNPGAIKQLFGSDNDNDMIVDNGVAFVLEKNLKAYSDTKTGIVTYHVRNTDTQIKQENDRIEDYKEHLEDYRKKLERDFTLMQQSLSELEQNQKRLENFSNAFGNKE